MPRPVGRRGDYIWTVALPLEPHERKTLEQAARIVQKLLNADYPGRRLFKPAEIVKLYAVVKKLREIA